MGKGRNIAYVRVSVIEQYEAGQKEALQTYGIDKWFIEKAKAKDTKRPVLKEMLEYVSEGDTVYVSEFACIGRTTAHLLAVIQYIKSRGARFISIKEDFDTGTDMGKQKLLMMETMAGFERAIFLEKQREGITLAKHAGKYKGRKKMVVENIGEYYHKYMTRQTNKTIIANELHTTRNTVDRLFRDYKKTLEADCDLQA